MGILLQFNSGLSFSWEELLNSTGLPPESLSSQMMMLVKSKVLLITNGQKLGTSSSQYGLNLDFKSKKVRINLNIQGRGEVKTENEETQKAVEEDRKLVIQVIISISHCIC
jgi:cullin 1